jgi:BirA family biotin operon repressor/biotin-[acetyl-CoA-carboxylase] ligase
MIRLSKAEIQSHLQLNEPVILHVLDTVDSTNRFLKDQPSVNGIQLCCAESQTAGRGRFGRVWHSPYGENLYFSVRFQIKGELSQWSGLSLVVSLAVIASLKMLGVDAPLSVKWPNDILWKGKNYPAA